MQFNTKKPEVIVVTGATAGVGRATVQEFAKQGVKIGLIARDIARLKATQKEVEILGGEAITISADVANYDQIESAAKLITTELGPIDIWINNAMVSVFSPAKEMTAEEYRRVTEVTYLGYVHGTLVALKNMLPRNQGVIIQVGSALAYRAIPLQSAYCAAKHAVQGFTESVRSELIHDKSNVKITMVQLPAMNTPQFNWTKNRLPRKPQPVPPIYQPEIGAKAIIWAAYHYRREWYVGWPTVIAIIADKFISGLGDRYLAKTAYDSQQYNGLADPNQKNNLFHAVAGNFNAHGDFNARSHTKCISLWINQHRSKFIILIITLLIILTLSKLFWSVVF